MAKKISQVVATQRSYVARPFSLVGHTHPVAFPVTVDDIAARDALTGDQRFEGIMVYARSDDTTYQLRGGEANTDWIELVSAAGAVSHTLLGDIGSNTHAQIDTHIALASVHFTQAAISITESQISDLGPYAAAVHDHDSDYLGILDTAYSSDRLDYDGGTVDVSAAAAPICGQVLTACDDGTAEWADPINGIPGSGSGDIVQTGTPAATHVGYFSADKNLTGDAGLTWITAAARLNVIGEIPEFRIQDSGNPAATMLGEFTFWSDTALVASLGFPVADGNMILSNTAGDITIDATAGSLTIDGTSGDVALTGYLDGYAGTPTDGQMFMWVTANGRAEFTTAPMGIVDNSTGVANQIVVFDGPNSAIGSSVFTWDTVALTAGAFVYDNFLDKLSVGDGSEATAGIEINGSAAGSPYINLQQAGSTVAIWRVNDTLSRTEISSVDDDITMRPGNVDTLTLTQAALTLTGNIIISGTVDGRDVLLDGTTQDSHIADATIHFTEASISIPLTQGANDVTATAAELNLLDLAGRTAGDILSADSATTASWKAPTVYAFGEYVGVFDATTPGTFPVATNQGDWFNCTVAGTIDSQPFIVGDTLIALVDSPSTTIFAANWSVIPHIGVDDHTLLTNIGTNTHAQIDTHIGDATLHFTEASIDIPLSQINDVTALAAEVNLLDLAGLTVGWVLSADSATTASWKAQTGGGGSIGGSITDNQIAVGATTADDIEGSSNLTWDGTTLTVNGTFTSLGIDDNATVEKLNITDSDMDFGGASGQYTLRRGLTNSNLNITGGSLDSLGANIRLYGESASLFGNDMNLRAGLASFLVWDESAGELELFTGVGTTGGSKTLALTIDSSQNATFAGVVNVVKSVYISGTTPNVRYYETAAALDQKEWQEFAATEKLTARIWDDAITTSYNWMVVERSGTGASVQVDTIDFTAATDVTINSDLLITGVFGFDSIPVATSINTVWLSDTSGIQADPVGIPTSQMFSNIYLDTTWRHLDDTAGAAFNVQSGLIRNYVTTTPNIINATALVASTEYRILVVGTTDFTLVGAASNTVGLLFTATGAGTGTGTATEAAATFSLILQIAETDTTVNNNLIVNGAFTSLGIDDNATEENMQLTDNVLTLGNGTSGYNITQAIDTASMNITGGNSAGVGGNIALRGSTHATLPGDVLLRSGLYDFLRWNESAGSFVVSTGVGAKTIALTIDSSQDATFAGAIHVEGGADSNHALDISDGGYTALLGADTSATTRTDATQKFARVGIPHYTLAEEDVAILIADINASSNNIRIGGGTSLYNAATAITFHTAANSTTTTGTLALTLDSSQNATFAGAVTVQGAFTSLGIDDNATGENLQLLDGAALFGTATTDFTIGHAATDALLAVSGGTSSSAGGNILLYGSTDAGAAYDTIFRAGTNIWCHFNESGGGLTFNTGIGSKTLALTLDASQDATFAGDVTLSQAATPTLRLTDTTNSVSNVVYSTDTVGGVGTTSAHNLTIIAGNTTAITIDDATQHATFAEKVIFDASTTADPSYNIPEGVAPTSPVDGDVWLTAAGEFFARLNGVSVDLATAGGGSPWTYTLQTGTSYTAVAGDFVVASNTGTVTITLPSGHSVNDTIIVKKTGATGTVTVDGNASETIDGATTFDLTSQYSSITLISDGTNWLIV